MDINTITNAILAGNPSVKLGDNMPGIVGVMKDGKCFTHNFNNPFDPSAPEWQPGYSHAVEVGCITLSVPLTDSITIDWLKDVYIHPYKVEISEDYTSVLYKCGLSPI